MKDRTNPLSAEAPVRVALYARVSTEDQAERGTVQTQLEFLRKYTGLYKLDVDGEYVDDGISGTVPLADRPEGQRLLQEARDGTFNQVLVYRLDRLGRSLKATLDAFDALEQAGVTIRSVTEPFDTSTAMGRFLFQFLGSMAELEKSTISERMTLGRDRVARQGRWTSGPVPFGYEVEDGKLTPSQRLVEHLSITEAEVARQVFDRIANGSTTIAEARRLNGLKVPTARRYASGKVVTVGDTWLPSRINAMVRNSVYAGVHFFKSQHGTIERETPALVDRNVWEKATAQLTKNRAMAGRNAKHLYLLRGLISCDDCGAHFAGTAASSRGKAIYYYRCNSQLGSVNPEASTRCNAKRVRAEWVEDRVWEHCRQFILNPGDALAEAQRQMEREAQAHESTADEAKRIERLIAEKETERDRVMTLFRRGTARLDESERQMDAIKAEEQQLHEMLKAIQAQGDLAEAVKSQYVQAEALLGTLAERLEEIEGADDWETKRQVVELLVSGIRVHTEGAGQQKSATLRVTYRFDGGQAVVLGNGSRGRSRDRG